MSAQPGVVAVVATMGRPVELAALLGSLANAGLRAAVIVDNGRDDATRRVVEGAGLPTVYHRPERNLGCGGGLHTAERLAFERFGKELTHLWVLDDDAVVQPDALRELLHAMAATGADAACALVTDETGVISWPPGLLDPVKYRAARESLPPEEYLRRCGPEPVAFSWSQGIALLVTRGAVEREGMHRGDFWMRGEDLDFSLRLTCRGRGIWVPRARVQHLPPAGSGRPEIAYLRDAALLQNVAYVGLRLPHGRRIARTLPGNWLRFVRTWGWTPRVLGESLRAVLYGALFGWTAGRTYGKDALS